MRRSVAAICLMVWILWTTAAQAQEAKWSLQLGQGGVYAPEDMALAYQEGVFLAGEVSQEDALLGEPLGGTDGFVAYVSPEGELVWSGRYGGREDDRFEQVIALPDGGCIAVGVTESADGQAKASRGGQDVFMVRIDAQGTLVWSKCLGGTYDDQVLDIQLNEEGMLYVCGKTQSRNGDFTSNQGGWDAWVAQLSLENGKPEWLKAYGSEGDDQFVSMMLGYDGLVVLGQLGEESTGGVIKAFPVAVSLDMTGEEQWSNTIGAGGDNLLDHWVETSSGWILSGVSATASPLMPTSHGKEEVWTMSLSHGGNVSWQRCYGGSGNERAHGLAVSSNGNYLILATTDSQNGQATGLHGGKDVWILCINALGTLKWQQTLGGSRDSVPVGMALMNNGEIWVAGSTTAQDGDIGRHPSACTGFLMRLATNGNLLETTLIGGKQECTLTDMLHADSGVYLLGTLRTIVGGEIQEDLYLTYFEE